MTRNPLFYLVLVLALLTGMLAVSFVKAVNRAAEQPFSEPNASLPGGDWEFPIDVGSGAQAKKGELTVNRLFITTSAPENSPVYLSKDGIYMKKNLDAQTPSSKIYWDQIVRWSEKNGDIYYDGSVGVGTDSLSSGVKLNVDGQIDMNDNRIINVGWPISPTDAATKGYVDKRAEKSLRPESSGDAWHYDDGSAKDITSLGDWDFCFLTGFERAGKGGNYHRIQKSRCELEKSSGEWTLITESGKKGHTRCGARCVNFGKTALSAVVSAPTAPTGFSTDWSCHNVCHSTPYGSECEEVCGVRLSWNDVNNETEYEIWRNWNSWQTLGQDTTQVYDDDTNPGTEYEYEIRACNNIGCSDWVVTSITTP